MNRIEDHDRQFTWRGALSRSTHVGFSRIDTFRTGYGAARGGLNLFNSPLGRKWTGRPGVDLDIGGEGRYPGAFNVNPAHMQSYNPDTLTDVGGIGLIPNRLPGSVDDIPLPSGTVGRLTLESTPILPGAGAEINRVLSPGGTATLKSGFDPSNPKTHHQPVIDAVGGDVSQTTDALGIVTTTITKSGC